MIPGTAARVPLSTNEAINEQIREQTNANIRHYTQASADVIEQRLQELDREWDIERTLEANAATVVLVGVGLGALVNRKFFAIPAIVGGFLLQHAVQGWCPPLPIMRRMGVRTVWEIERERSALRAALRQAQARAV
ncbi:MAG TPA: hypothetical protein VM452_01145 [Caulifigura sp.]|nr:hypothetical protein [Caulifigura sp.]